MLISIKLDWHRVSNHDVLTRRLLLSLFLFSVKGGVQSTGKRRFRIPVNNDPHHLVTHLSGSNIYKVGEDIKIKDDSHYPDWIWTAKIDGPPALEDFTPDDEEYWEWIEHTNKARKYRLMRSKPKDVMVVGKLEKENIEYKERLKFRALATYNAEPGWDPELWEHNSQADIKLWLRPQDSMREEPLYPDKLAQEEYHKIQDIYRPDVVTHTKRSRHKRRHGRFEQDGIIY